MKEENFIYFLELLRILEKCGLAERRIEDAMFSILNSSGSRLDEQQRHMLFGEFSEYADLKRKSLGIKIAEMEEKSISSHEENYE